MTNIFASLYGNKLSAVIREEQHSLKPTGLHIHHGDSKARQMVHGHEDRSSESKLNTAQNYTFTSPGSHKWFVVYQDFGLWRKAIHELFVTKRNV